MKCRYCDSEMFLDFRFERTAEDPLEEGYSCPKCKAEMFYSELDWYVERWTNKEGVVEIVNLPEIGGF